MLANLGPTLVGAGVRSHGGWRFAPTDLGSAPIKHPLAGLPRSQSLAASACVSAVLGAVLTVRRQTWRQRSQGTCTQSVAESDDANMEAAELDDEGNPVDDSPLRRFDQNKWFLRGGLRNQGTGEYRRWVKMMNIEKRSTWDKKLLKSQPFDHPPRSERHAKLLPFRGNRKYWDFITYPKAYFPWSKRPSGGRPWHALAPIDLSRGFFFTILHAGCLFAPRTFSWDAFRLFFIGYVLTAFGITYSYHRQLAHRSFDTPRWFEYLWAYIACLALQGDPIEWVSGHRHHHGNCDTELDPHSPKDGFWWSHMGWMLDRCGSPKLYETSNVRDLRRQRFYRFLENSYPVHAVILPAVGLYCWGGWPYVVWGLCVRTVFVWHVTFAINSISHVWGYQSWKTGDISMNNWFTGILALGEGWHNNHHAFETSCRHGLKWWEFDFTYMMIRIFSMLGLVRNRKYPLEKRMAQLELA